MQGSTESRRKTFPAEELQKADGFVIVYSITDRNSFTFAVETLELISAQYNQQNPLAAASLATGNNHSNSSTPNSSPNASPQPKATCPILIIANKCDLEHLRVVEKVEGLSLSMQYGCHFHELSVAENSPEVYTSFQTLISTFVTQNSQPSKRKFSVSKMLGNLRIGRTSPSHQVVTSQASIIDTSVDSSCSESTDNIPSRVSQSGAPTITHIRQSSAPETSTSAKDGSNLSSSICNLKSKLVELHSMKKRHNSPPICSL